MSTPDLVKLAPNLSAEERYKLITADFLAQLDGEQPMITESELKAMLWFASRDMWKEYALRVVTFKLVNAIWVREIETEKLRTYACYLLAIHQLERVIVDAEDKLPKDKRAKQFKNLKTYVEAFNDSLEGFRVYREAIPILERELCGVPFFSKTTKASIATSYALVDHDIATYNEAIKRFCDCSDAKKLIKPILDDTDSYLVKGIVPAESDVTKLVENIKELAESEMRSRE